MKSIKKMALSRNNYGSMPGTNEPNTIGRNGEITIIQTDKPIAKIQWVYYALRLPIYRNFRVLNSDPWILSLFAQQVLKKQIPGPNEQMADGPEHALHGPT